ncbi:MAG: RNA polymerase sigma-70 factor [Chitinophaga sp.]|uniref:RNA polymerase sigma factor n=1 Tax=Chitinophaga sp. TaxID=1869181 RepID=UPI0025C5A225|nr:RNA polymerase sigma-70 factor [Chitinophaga sp.]MBV8252060.1 RNA polymerase sigma-70 factor [Chitinophaga sp.]
MKGAYTGKNLLMQVAAGNEIAFANLFHDWRNKLYTYILRITDSPETAEDVVQEVFLKIWLRRTELNEIDNFSAYLYKMAHNHAISGIRRMAQETFILAELYQEALPGLPADEAMLKKQIQEKLKMVVSRLPLQQRLVYTLSRDEGMKQEDIARQLNITISTVQNHMTQALRNIRRELTIFLAETPGLLIFLLLSGTVLC